MSRRRRAHTPASRVITRKAETGEVLSVDPAYGPSVLDAIVERGNAKTDASARARKRRAYNGKGA